jgi:hypothetical protein
MKMYMDRLRARLRNRTVEFVSLFVVLVVNLCLIDDEPGKTCHVRINVIENVPQALVAPFKQDFPIVQPWQ